jgi:hypothetical protein
MVVAQYEALRGTVLGDALAPEARAGLLLFLRRGMCGWARVVATRNAPQRPAGTQPSTWTMPEEHRAVVHILAAMAIHTNRYGATHE